MADRMDARVALLLFMLVVFAVLAGGLAARFTCSGEPMLLVGAVINAAAVALYVALIRREWQVES